MVGGTEETVDNLGQVSRIPDRESNLGHSEHQAELKIENINTECGREAGNYKTYSN